MVKAYFVGATASSIMTQLRHAECLSVITLTAEKV
jgi:hypothetical protein